MCPKLGGDGQDDLNLSGGGGGGEGQKDSNSLNLTHYQGYKLTFIQCNYTSPFNSTVYCTQLIDLPVS